MNEELVSNSSLDLMLMQRPRDENPELQEVCAHLEIDPLQA